MAAEIALHVEDINNIDLSVIMLLVSTVFICITLYNRPYIKRQVQLVATFISLSNGRQYDQGGLKIKMPMRFLNTHFLQFIEKMLSDSFDNDTYIRSNS